MKLSLFLFVLCISAHIHAESQKPAWDKLLLIASTKQKALLLEEAAELGYPLPDSWKDMWQEESLRPYLLEIASPSDLELLIQNSPIDSWSRELKRQFALICSSLKKEQRLPSGIQSILKEVLSDAPWLDSPTQIPSPEEVSGNPLQWNPTDCEHHLKKIWDMDVVKIILKSDRFDLNYALSQAWNLREETLEKSLFEELWKTSSIAGRTTIAKVLISNPNPQILASVKTFFESRESPELCLRIFKAMNPPSLASWLMDQYQQKKEDWMTLGLHYMIDAKDVEQSRRCLDLYNSKLVQKQGLSKDLSVILMGMSKHPDVVPFLSKLLRSKMPPVGPTFIIQAMAEHGDPTFLKIIERMNKKEGTPLTQWALERLKGEHDRPYIPATLPPSRYYPTFKHLP